MTTRWKITIEYDGRPFCGWQIQKHDQCSVQESLQKALFALSGEEQEIYGSGRTDAGVHARGQVAHFDLEKDFTEDNIRLGINAHLKDLPISILSAEKADLDFHARFLAKSRSYRYQLITRPSRLALDEGLYAHIPSSLDADLIQKAIPHFIGKHDFTSFRTVHCQAKSPIKTITRLSLKTEEDKFIFDITAPSFLHHQVRNIIGTLIEVGKGKISPDDIPKIIHAKDRSAAGPTAPAEGLYFIAAAY